jgi:DNA processing protein
MSNETLYSLALTSVEGLGCRTAHRLLDHFRTPAAIFSATAGQMAELGLPEVLGRALLSDKTKADAELAWSQCQQNHVQILTWQDDNYPRLLKEIYDPPIVLFYRGELECLQAPGVAVVGSRHATPYGINVAEKLASDLARVGVVVTSGLARGIDSAAHRGALEAKGKTIAVLGSGLDCLYPRENQKLARQIESQGCLLTEFRLGTPPSPQNFPVRNRIISGLALGTCVVEAAEFSGSLITARLALEQGREVFAVPGNITAKTSFGPNLWIKQGAKLVQDWQDVVEELPLPVRQAILARLESGPSSATKDLFAEVLTEVERRVLELLPDDAAVHVDQLLETAGLSSSELLATLLGLEMKDKIKQLRGKYFMRKL